MNPLISALSRPFIWAAFFAFFFSPRLSARMMDNGVDPANLGKGEHIYVLSEAINGMKGNVPSVNSLATMMTYLKSQGIEYLVVKAGDGGIDYYYPPGNLQFSSSLVNAAHAAGIKIMGYTRSHGTNVPAEINLAARVYNLGADGFVIDAEAEWESNRLPDNLNKALQLGAGIKALFPNKFLGHAPFPYITSHSSFPYKEFGLYCDAVLPQVYWNEIDRVNCSPTQMVADMSSQWRTWQNSLTGNWTNAIKPICPLGSAWNGTACNVTGDQIREFIAAIKADPNPATKGGYHGVNYWRAELHTADMWAGVKDGDIGTAPVVLKQPPNLTVTNLNPTNVTLSVEAAGGNPLKYQWRFNGIPIPGATNWTHTIANAQFTNGGAYSVIITNHLGSTNSANGTLTVRSKPQVTVQPLNQIVVVSNSVTFTAAANGTTPLSYQWKFNGATIAGATTNAYTRSNAAFTHGGDYTLVITNAYGASTSAIANLTVVAATTPPIITLQPQGKTILAGSNATFTVAATGTGPITYQWRRNGTNLAGATGSTLTLTNVATSGAGNYSVIASNSAGLDTSMNAALAVHYALHLTITGGGNVTKNLNAASYASGTVVTLTANSGLTSWSGSINSSINPVAVTMDGHKNITANFSSADVIIESRNPDGTAPAASLYTDNLANSTLKSSAAPLSGSATQGSRYSGSGTPFFTAKPILIGVSGIYQVEVTHGSASSISTDMIVTNSVTGGSLSASSTIAFQRSQAANSWMSVGQLLLNPGVTNPTLKFAYASGTLNSTSGRFYSDAIRFLHLPLPFILTPPASQTNLVGGSATFVVEAARATGYQWRFGGNNISGATTSSYTRNNLQTNDAGNYSVVVSGDNGSATSVNAVLTINTLPVVSTPPASQLVNQGDNATFTVTASGTAALSYQWRFVGVDIPGATNTAYTRSNVQTPDAGDYSVVVKNPLGAVISANAALSIRTPPVITAHPADKTVNPGASATFTVAAEGAGPLLYQWQFNGDNIAGATATTYTVTGANQAKAGFYEAVVSNTAGATTSDPANLTVNTPPSIYTHPESQSIYIGATTTFIVEAHGTPPYFYQWYFNNAPLSGATNPTFTRLNAQTNHSGHYFADVFNAVGQASTLTATLSVTPQPTELLAPQILADKKIQLIFTGQPGRTNIVESSSNLITWLPLATNLNTNGTTQFIDSATNLPWRFYRTRQP